GLGQLRRHPRTGRRCAREAVHPARRAGPVHLDLGRLAALALPGRAERDQPLQPRVPRLRLSLPRPGNDLGAADPADLRREGKILMRALRLSLLLAAACTPDFAAQSDVTDLRILAVQAEPPEAKFDPTQTPPTVDPVVVTVLAVDPRVGGPMTMTFQLCAP